MPLGRGAIVLDHPDRNPAIGQCGGIVRTQADGGMAMANGGNTVLLAPPFADIQNFVTQSGLAMRESIVGLEGKGALQQRQQPVNAPSGIPVSTRGIARSTRS